MAYFRVVALFTLLTVYCMTMAAPVADLKISEVTNTTLSLQWGSSAPGSSFTVNLSKVGSKDSPQSQSITAEKDGQCTVEFTDLKPLTKYTVSVSAAGETTASKTLEIMSQPSLEMPEIEAVQEHVAHLTLAPLPESEAKDVIGYLLLVCPLEDAKDIPADGITDTVLKSELTALIEPPFYIAYEFTQEQLSEEEGGQILVGSGSAKKDGKYGTVQDPKLSSGGFYKVVLAVLMNVDNKRSIFVQESSRMLVPESDSD